MLFGGRKRRRAVWSQVATDLGGVHQLPTKWWRDDEQIRAVMRGVEVKLDTYTVSTGQGVTHVYTRVGAAYAFGPGPKMKVTATGFFTGLGRALGMQDIAVGNPAFDDMFVVKADNPAVARRLWSSSHSTQMLAHGDAWITSEAARVELIGSGRWEDPANIHHAFELVAQLASADLFGLEALGSIGGNLVQPEGARPYVELDTGTRVVITAEDRGEDLVMVARAEGIQHEPLGIKVLDGTPTELASKLPQGAQVQLSRVGTGTLEVDKALTFTWTDLELDPARLRAGAELLGAIAAGSSGLYR